MPDVTEHYGLDIIGAEDVQGKTAIIDGNTQKIERGRTIKRLAGEALARLALVYIDPSTAKFRKATSADRPLAGFIVAPAATNEDALAQVEGVIEDDAPTPAWNWTPGARLYASTSPGALTETPTGAWQPAVAQALSATAILILPGGLSEAPPDPETLDRLVVGPDPDPGGPALLRSRSALLRTLRVHTLRQVAPTVSTRAVSTWTARTSAADNNWHSIAWSPELGLFAAVANTGSGNRVMTSPDGITWTLRTTPADNDWHSIAWSPELGLFAAVAYSGSGNRVMTSPDGITWTARTSAADNGWLGIAWSPELGLFAAVANTGSGNRVMTSPDGITWTLRTTPADNDWHSIAWSPELGLFAAVSDNGSGNRVMTSPDGITWTARTSAADNGWLGIAWSPELGLFAAVANTGSGNRVMTSRAVAGLKPRLT